MKTIYVSSLACALVLSTGTTQAQPIDISTFDTTAKGAWSEPARTTLAVPKVPNDSVKLDGAATSQEYGGFKGVTVDPGVNAWILDFPADRAWDGAADSSFTYWLAHDDDYFYVGVHAKDDVVTSDDPNTAFWKDDAIEIVVDALADRLDNNTDTSKDPIGGHSYVNFQGRFSAWDEAGSKIGATTWATAVDWKYGETGDVFGFGKSVAGGWQMEVRFKKRLFEDATAGNKLRNGYRMGFNIGMDDDDKKGIGASGNKSRSQDLEIQYWWANRERRKGLTAEVLAGLTPADKAAKRGPDSYLQTFELGIDSAGRLAHGGTGEIIFGFDTRSSGKILFITSNAGTPINADPALIALLEAKGYTVTLLTPPGTADELRAATKGQDLVILSETIGSTSVVDPVGQGTGIFSLKNSDIPIISFEPYMWDNADWVKRTEDGSNDFMTWGNSGRTEADVVGLLDARDSLQIMKAGHPLAAGLTGKVKVYDVLYSLNYGIPSADADVIASITADGKFPTIFVYEKGDKLVDGSVSPNLRIGMFLGQNANPNANTTLAYEDLSAAGRALFLGSVEYALPRKAVPTLSLARSGTDLVVTFGGGTLQSADAVTGPWKDETSPSPLKILPSAGAKFYRVKGN
ncbi:MAG: hypothetical protein FJ398_15715 [Verrucomicrobia bacterium]|nr:hypothetical protein [Verrucomicrobiota bacterium]